MNHSTEEFQEELMPEEGWKTFFFQKISQAMKDKTVVKSDPVLPGLSSFFIRKETSVRSKASAFDKAQEVWKSKLKNREFQTSEALAEAWGVVFKSLESKSKEDQLLVFKKSLSEALQECSDQRGIIAGATLVLLSTSMPKFRYGVSELEGSSFGVFYETTMPLGKALISNIIRSNQENRWCEEYIKSRWCDLPSDWAGAFEDFLRGSFSKNILQNLFINLLSKEQGVMLCPMILFSLSHVSSSEDFHDLGKAVLQKVPKSALDYYWFGKQESQKPSCKWFREVYHLMFGGMLEASTAPEKISSLDFRRSFDSHMFKDHLKNLKKVQPRWKTIEKGLIENPKILEPLMNQEVLLRFVSKQSKKRILEVLNVLKMAWLLDRPEWLQDLLSDPTQGPFFKKGLSDLALIMVQGTIESGKRSNFLVAYHWQRLLGEDSTFSGALAKMLLSMGSEKEALKVRKVNPKASVGIKNHAKESKKTREQASSTKTVGLKVQSEWIDQEISLNVSMVLLKSFFMPAVTNSDSVNVCKKPVQALLKQVPSFPDRFLEKPYQSQKNLLEWCETVVSEAEISEAKKHLLERSLTKSKSTTSGAVKKARL